MTQLSLPEPCSEKWSDMTPVGTGCRFCAACERNIVDFTQKSDEEIIAILQAGGKICGRFRDDQLNRPLRPAAAYRRLYARRGGLTAAAASMVALLAAQGSREAVPRADMAVPRLDMTVPRADTTAPHASELTEQQILQRQTLGKPEVYHYLDEEDTLREISGKIVDAEFQKGLPGVAISLKNTKYGAVTDAEGVFRFEVPLHLLQHDSATLRFSYTGYTASEALLPERVRMENVSVLYSLQPEFSVTAARLAESLQGVTGIVVVSVTEEKPRPAKRIGNFFKRLWPAKKKKYVMGCPRF
jgi:hypothetical protein